MDRFIDECMLDPSLQEHLTVLCRVFQNNRAKVQGDSMLFSDDIFTIEPVVSNSWDLPPHPSPPVQAALPHEHHLAFPTEETGMGVTSTRLSDIVWTTCDQLLFAECEILSSVHLSETCVELAQRYQFGHTLM